jgi:hypothetical protein
MSSVFWSYDTIDSYRAARFSFVLLPMSKPWAYALLQHRLVLFILSQVWFNRHTLLLALISHVHLRRRLNPTERSTSEKTPIHFRQKLQVASEARISVPSIDLATRYTCIIVPCIITCFLPSDTPTSSHESDSDVYEPTEQWHPLNLTEQLAENTYSLVTETQAVAKDGNSLR